MKSCIYFFLLLMSIMGSGALISCSHHSDDLTPQAYLSMAKSTDKLILAQMSISKMATIDDIDLSKAEGYKQVTAGIIDALKIGDRKAAYSYRTYLRAFIDLTQLTPDDVKIDNRAKTITLYLPHIRTEYAGRDVTFREDHYRVTGLRDDIYPAERAEIKDKMNEVLKQEVEENSLFRTRLEEEAKRRCDLYFQSLPGTEDYTVTVNYH